MESDRIQRFVDLVPLVVGALTVTMLAQIWAARMFYPYDLEWMEGGMLAHAWRMQQGLPIYVEPGPDWIPFIYPPGYAAMIAAAGQVFGLSHAVGRALSLAGTMAAGLAIVFGVRRQTGHTTPGVLAAMLFLSCYIFAGGFYDLVRLDGVYIGLLGWCIVLGAERFKGALEASALLLAAAFLFKQNVALFGIPIALALWRRDGPSGAMRYFAWSGGPALAFTGFMQWKSGGVYLTYLLAVPASHPIVGPRLYGTMRELGWALVIPAVGVALWLVAREREAQKPLAGVTRFTTVAVALGTVAMLADVLIPEVRGIPRMWPIQSAPTVAALCVALLAVGFTMSRDKLSWTWSYGIGIAVVMMVTTAVMRAHHGGFLNVHIPMYWGVSLAAGLAMGAARNEWKGMPLHVATAGAMAVQLGINGAQIDREKLTPTAADLAAGDRIVMELRQVDGPVLAPYAPWLAHAAGHAPGTHLISMWDVAHERSPFGDMRIEYGDAAMKRHWGAILTGPARFKFDVHTTYKIKALVQPKDKTSFFPKTGWRARPKHLLVPKRPKP